MKAKARFGRLAILLLMSHAAVAFAVETNSSSTNTVRVAAAQAARRVIDFRLKPDEALAAVEKNFAELERIVERAGEAKCDALVLPEDTLGLLNWVGANETLAKDLLPKAVNRMIDRLGSAAARYHMSLVVCGDCTEGDGATYNTAFLLGRDGKEIGRYHKTCPTWSEAGVRQRGSSFPVFSTPDLGTVGMLICYDLVVPETARCLALAGADIIFFPTMGGAAIGDDDIGVQALRVRAAENFIWLVVAHRGDGAMIISPRGKIVAQAEGADGLAVADIDPRGQREGGDALNWQHDMRARLFRERNAEAFNILIDKNPPVLAKVPIGLTQQEAGRIMARALTLGEDEFKQANELVDRGQTDEAISAFERLRQEYPATWIDRRSQERLAKLQPATPKADASTSGLAARYPGDVGIASDPAVLFADNFESGDMRKWDQQRGRVVMTEDDPHSGRWSVQMPMERGKNRGGDAIKWFMPGADAVYARFYVKFSPNYQYNHHFVWLGANQRTNKWSAFGKAGLKPDGTYYSTGMEPWFAWGKNPPPGEVNLYAYYLDMEPDRKMNKYWGNAFFPPGPDKGQAAGVGRVIPPLNQWQCWEFMIQANSAPDKADGKQAMWVDGNLIGDFTGIRWRNDLDLKVNCFWLEHYGYDEGDPTKQYWKDSQSVWFDDVVVARRYIGPMNRVTVINPPLKSEPGDAISPKDGVIQLFNGRDLTGLYTWLKNTQYRDPSKVFTVTNGLLRISGEVEGYIATQHPYKDYRLVVEYRWGTDTHGRKTVRNSGILLHGVGPDGNASPWMSSIECQVAQGCVGDFIVIRGKQEDGTTIPVTITSETILGPDGRTRWKRGGERRVYSGRQFWWSLHDPDFKEDLDTRGRNDVESPPGEWTRVECICEGTRITVLVNGTTVNECFDVVPSAGKILLESEGFEIFFRKFELHALKARE